MDTNSFWKEIKLKKKCITPLPNNMEGVTGEQNIATLWKRHFEELYNCQRRENPTEHFDCVADIIEDIDVREEIISAIKD